MANIGTAYFQLMPSMKGVEAEIKKALGDIDTSAYGKQSGKKWSGGFTSVISKGGAVMAGVFGGIASTAVTGLIGAVSSLGSAMVEAADSSQKFASTLSFAGIDDSTIQQLTESTQAYADQTVYDLTDIRNVTAQLAANGVENYAQLAEAAGNLNAVAGGSADTFRSVSMVMSQTAGQGKLVTENWNQLVDAIPGASGALEEAMRSAGAFEGNFREAMENGEISAEEFFDAVQKLGMQDVAVEAAKSTSTIEGALGNLEASVVGLGSTLITELTPAITGAMNGITEFVTMVTTAFDGFFEDMNNGADFATAFSENFGPLIDTIGQKVMEAFNAVVAALPTILPMLTTAATNLFMGIVSALPTIIPNLIAALTSVITTLITTLPTWLPQVLSSALNLFMGIVQAVPQILGSLLGAIGSLIMSGIGHLATFAGDVLASAKELWDNACEGVRNTLEGFAAAVGEVVQGGINAVGNFIQSAVDAGANLINGFIDGVRNAAQNLINAVGDVINDAIGFAKSLLGIASPSKVFAEIGKFTMQGMAEGIEGGAKYAVSAMDSAMKDVYGASRGFGVKAAFSSTSDASMWGNGINGINQTINFNQPIQSPAQTANMLKRYATYGLAGAR